MSITNAKALASLGCNLTISANVAYSPTELKEILDIMKKKEGQLTINAVGYTMTNLKEIFKLAGPKVTIII